MSTGGLRYAWSFSHLNNQSQQYSSKPDRKSDLDFSATLTYRKKNGLNDNGNIQMEFYSSSVSVEMGHKTILDKVRPILLNTFKFGARLNGPVPLIWTLSFSNKWEKGIYRAVSYS